MAAGIDRHLAEMSARGAADRRNGSYRRWLMTELGEIELAVPRTRNWSALTNAIERRFREVRRRTRPMGVFQDRTSMDRILFAVFTHKNSTQGVPTLFSLTQGHLEKCIPILSIG